jgi:anti-sigma factor RsiW
MTTFNLTCEAVGATLPDYLDGTLEPWVRTSIEEHLAGCARCTTLAREIRNITREASTLPRLLPEEDVWPRIAGRIGAPVLESGTLADSASLTPPPEQTLPTSYASFPFSEPHAAAPEAAVVSDPSPLEREVPVPISESLVQASAPPPVVESDVPPLERLVGLSTSESFVQAGALPPVVANELPAVEREVRLPISEPFVQVSEPPIVSDEPTSLEREVPLPPSDSPPPVIAPAPPPDTAAAPGTATVYPLTTRREQTWRQHQIGLAAAALVLVTAGTTFLLTVQWLGPAGSPNVASDTRTGKLSSTEGAATVPGSRARASGREQPAPDALAPAPPPGQLHSALTVSPRSAPLVARSPEDAVYDREILVLQRIVRRQKRELDTSTVAEIEKNLQALDSAIGQIRAALQQDPGNSMLDGQSSRALEMKVELLRRAAMLRSST